MMSDLDQRRRTVRVLGLLSDSFEARVRGDHAGMDRLMSEAAELDVDAVSVIQGGIVIGEIPNPERDWPAWGAYVAAAREALAAAEHQNPAAEHGGN
jgi:hypothetical protein